MNLMGKYKSSLKRVFGVKHYKLSSIQRVQSRPTIPYWKGKRLSTHEHSVSTSLLSEPDDL